MPPPSSTRPPPGGRGILVGAPASGQGKTTVTLGLLRALRRQGVEVVSAKSGPDYIDPAFHAAATGVACVNLDSWAMREEDLRARAPIGQVLVVEGAMGLLDGAAGAAPGGPGSSLAVAEALGIGVVLVIDAARMGQSVAALVDGFGRAGRCPLAGVILNRVGSVRHGEMLRRSVAPIAPVLGMLPAQADLAIPSRHLGLVQADERADLEAFIEHAADWVCDGCDLEAIQHAARPIRRGEGAQERLAPLGQRIAVARDRAFGFSYTHMLADWGAQGAEMIPFSPLAGEAPDAAADAVFLPGGYPELHAGTLAANGAFFQGLHAAAARGALIYGECGGYMVLGEGLIDADGTRHAMAGLLRLETDFATRQRHLGYRQLEAASGPLRGAYRGHEFHYATTRRAEGVPLFEARDAEGGVLPPMGLRDRQVMGSFAHIIAPAVSG